MHTIPPSDPDGYLELIRRAPTLTALREGGVDRQTLEERLDVSRATSHRLTRWLGNRGLVERVDGEFRLTPLGQAIEETVMNFKIGVTTTLWLAPVLAALDETYPSVPLRAFDDAVVTSPDHGDPYAPMMRFVSLVRETTTLRGFDTWTIAPTYLDEIQACILDGMVTDLIDPVTVVEDVMERSPERCVQVCVSGYLTIRLHDSLPFGLALFDDRIGVAVRDPETDALTAFVETDDPEARAWAESVYDCFKAESVLLENFTKKGLREASPIH